MLGYLGKVGTAACEWWKVRYIYAHTHAHKYSEDTALFADSEEKSCRLLSEFGTVCKRRKL